jgi:hypothetical protein
MPITLEDKTHAMALVMFGKKWPYPSRQTTTPGTRTYTIYLNGYGWTHTPKLAAVCKMWHAEVKQQLQLQLCWTATHIHESAVDRALKMCNSAYYENHWEFPEIPLDSTSRSYLYLDEEQVFSVTFTRRRVSQFAPAQELLAQYGGPQQPGSSPWPVKTIYIPTVCWIPRSVVSPEQRAECEAWRATQLAALPQWLGEQHAALVAE